MPEGLHWCPGEGRGKHGSEKTRKRPADVLAAKWMLGKSAAFDFTVTSPLASNIIPFVFFFTFFFKSLGVKTHIIHKTCDSNSPVKACSGGSIHTLGHPRSTG